jgi:DNA-binding MarR family transcriptional regulator
MYPEELKSKSIRFLVTLYTMADKKVGREISSEKIFDIIGINYHGKNSILAHLADNRLVSWTDSAFVSITNTGLLESEKFMKSTYAERELNVLRAIYELGKGQPENWVLIDDLGKALEMSFQEINSILIDLEKRKRLIGAIEEAVWMLPAGIEKIEALDKESYTEQEYIVLEKIAKDCSINGGMSRSALAESLSMSPDYLYVFLIDFEKKGWISLTFGENGKVEVTPQGITAFHKMENRRDQTPPQTYVGDIYNTHIYAPSNNQIGGRGNIQNAQININPEFESAIKSLLELVRKSDLTDIDKEDAISEIERLNQLAQKEKTPQVIERAQKGISLLKSLLEVGELAMKVSPLIHTISSAF